MGADTLEKAEKAKYQALAASMRDLLRSPGWDSYRKVLEDAENGWIQSLIAGGKDAHDYNNGVITGLRFAFNIPQQIINRASQL